CEGVFDHSARRLRSRWCPPERTQEWNLDARVEPMRKMRHALQAITTWPGVMKEAPTEFEGRAWALKGPPRRLKGPPRRVKHASASLQDLPDAERDRGHQSTTRTSVRVQSSPVKSNGWPARRAAAQARQSPKLRFAG